jgi:hypothetical protein
VANGLADGVDKYPSFLAGVPGLSSRTNNDADFATDEDRLDSVDNDQDGLVDEDPYDHVAPAARMFGWTNYQGTNHVLNVLVYNTSALPQFPAAKGYSVWFIFDDPTVATSGAFATSFCSHQDHRLFQYAVALENTTAAGTQGGAKLITNDAAAVTEQFGTQITSLPDADGDRIENGLDACTFAADNDHDGTPDQSDATPWNPRLVSQSGDPDVDGLPTGCDRPENLAPAVGECAEAIDSDFDAKVNDGCPASGAAESGANCDNATDNDGDTLVNDGCPALGDPNVPSPPGSDNDQDEDGDPNVADNCPDEANSDQTDSDNDRIGDVCDPSPAGPTGTALQLVYGTPVCTGGVNSDGDRYCADVDPNDTLATGHDVIPEASAYEPQVCNDGEDNDVDGPRDLDDSGCGDVDIDGVLNDADNCPGIPPASTGPSSINFNPDQTDSDSDTLQVGQQPYGRSAGGAPIGDPSTVIGEPYGRSDKWGGDACDPDDDNDGLPDGNGGETGACRTVSDCDGDFLGDWPEYLRSACLNMTVANNAGANPDGDALFTYGEALIGTDPCTSTTGANFNTDQDGDGYLSAPERYIDDAGLTISTNNPIDTIVGTDPLNRCGSGVIPAPSDAWPSDFASGGLPNSTDKITLTDITSFTALPRKLGTSPSTQNFIRRWDVVPGPGLFGTYINLNDLTALINGTTGSPPMFGERAFNGDVCSP